MAHGFICPHCNLITGIRTEHYVSAGSCSDSYTYYNFKCVKCGVRHNRAEAKDWVRVSEIQLGEFKTTLNYIIREAEVSKIEKEISSLTSTLAGLKNGELLCKDTLH